MKLLYRIAFFVLLLCYLTGCQGQVKSDSGAREANMDVPQKLVGGGCDGCEIMFTGMPANIKAVDTSAGWAEKGQKLLVTGTVHQLDGKTPAPDVIIYYWQTDNNGYYSPVGEMDTKARRHGHIRGWVKSDAQGKYSIYTIRPMPYPNERMPAHIHIAIKEPHLNNEYYIDEFVFDDDPLLTGEKRKLLENRGGSGVLRVLLKDSLQIALHNIVLGLNIPNYPATSNPGKQSGLQIGEDQPSFIPFHAYGPDKGTRTCPVCKYGRYHGIVYFVGNHPDWAEIKKWLLFLEKESVSRSQYLKAYFVYGHAQGYQPAVVRAQLEKLGDELGLKKMALTFVPSMGDAETEVNLNKINAEAENTFIVYRHRTIIDKFVDLKPTDDNFNRLILTLNKTKGDYFELQEPRHE